MKQLVRRFVCLLRGHDYWLITYASGRELHSPCPRCGATHPSKDSSQ